MSMKTRKFRHTFAAGSIAALAALSLAACSGGGSSSAGGGSEDCTPVHEFETIEPGVLTLATYDYPPATLIEGDGVTGWEGDILTEFAKRECLTLNVTSAGGAGAVIPSIETSRADIGAGSWYRTDEREKIVRLSAPTVLDASAIISMDGVTADQLADGVRVASVSGNLWNESLQGWLGDSFAVYQDDEAIYGDLAAGRIDAIVASMASAATRFEDNPIEGAQVIETTPVDEVPEFAKPGLINFPTTLDNDALGAALDETIETMREEGFIGDLLEGYGLDRGLADIKEVYNL